MLTVGVSKRFQHTSTFDSTNRHERPSIQSQAAAVVDTMDMDMDTSLRDRLVCTGVPNNVVRGGANQSRPQSSSLFLMTGGMRRHKTRCSSDEMGANAL